MRIAAFTQDRGACTGVRLKQPMTKISRLGLAETYSIGLMDPNTDTEVQKADAVVFGRAASPNVIQMIRTMHSWGKKIVLDLDDNIFEISPISPHYRQLGIMPVNMDSIDGRTVPMWVNGQEGFDAGHNRRLRKNFIDVIREVDCVTVTTPPLAEVYRRYNDCVRVVPNAIDFSIWEKPPIRYEGGGTRLLYTGAANHQEDWMFVMPVLVQLQRKYPDLTIVLCGADWKFLKTDLDYSRIECHEWVDFEAYPFLLKSLCCDIGIAPISKTHFNDCRSSLKWNEYSALKMATVASKWGPYARDVEDGRTGLLVYGEQDEWLKALCSVIEDKELRVRLANNAYRKNRKDFNLDYIAEDWVRLFQELTGRN